MTKNFWLQYILLSYTVYYTVLNYKLYYTIMYIYLVVF